MVLDSWALLAWLGAERGAARVRSALRRAEKRGLPLLMSAINAGEVFYLIAKRGDIDRAEELAAMLRRRQLPVRLVPATNARVWRAARLKARHSIAYADAFAAALAAETRRPLLTGDRDFAALEQRGVCTISWLRS